MPRGPQETGGGLSEIETQCWSAEDMSGAQAQPGTGQEASVGVRSGQLGLALLALFTSQLLAFSPPDITSMHAGVGRGGGIAVAYLSRHQELQGP